MLRFQVGWRDEENKRRRRQYLTRSRKAMEKYYKMEYTKYRLHKLWYIDRINVDMNIFSSVTKGIFRPTKAIKGGY